MSDVWLNLVLLVLGGGISGFLNVVAGGGSLITVPLLIFMGVPATSANGTIRFAIWAQAVTATVRYHRAGVVQWKAMPKLAAPTCIGAVFGALVATRMADTDFKSLIGWITLVAGALVAIDIKRFLKDRDANSGGGLLRLLGFVLVMGAVGFYGGLAQAGVGYLFLAALVLVGGMDLVEANVHKMVIVVFFTPLAIVIFGLNAQINVPYAIALTIGQIAGAFVGAGLTLKKGASYIRPILAIVVMAAAIKLLFG